MKNTLKRLLVASLAAGMVLSMAACESKSESSSSKSSSASAKSAVEEIKKSGTLTMCTNAEFAPFEYKEGNDIKGIDVEISQAVADDLGVKLKISDIAFDSLIPSLQAGKADMAAAGMTVTEDRKKNVDFSDTYFDASQAIIVPKDSSIKTRTDLNDKIVGVQTGTTGDTYCTNQDGKSDIKVKEVRRYNKGMDAVADLISGRIEAVVIDNYPAQKLVSQNPDKTTLLSDSLTSESYAIACPKGSDLTAEINKVLKDLKDSGKLQEIMDKYISVE